MRVFINGEYKPNIKFDITFEYGQAKFISLYGKYTELKKNSFDIINQDCDDPSEPFDYNKNGVKITFEKLAKLPYEARVDVSVFTTDIEEVYVLNQIEYVNISVDK
jgi:hypothetical protein